MINDYKEVKVCVYKDEHYSVRDNGAIMRHLREGKKARRDDGIWTFGLKNPQNGYMMLGQHRVHIIVATAFLGARDSKVYVVDHIDTNRCNNRVENLRWFTRLENALNNEITRNKIIYICGSIEAFIENPNILRERLDQVKEPSLEWMRTVTKEAAATAYENIKRYWAEQANNPKPLVGGKLNDGVYRKKQTITQYMPTSSNKATTPTTTEGISEQENRTEQSLKLGLVKAKSPETAWQMKWKTPTDFLCCPETIGDNPIEEYYNRIVIGEAYNSTSFYGSNEVQKVIDKAHTKENTIIVISCNHNSIKPYALSKIHYFEGKFIHESLGTFFEEDGGRKYFTLEQGLEWTGEDPFDDYC